VSRFYSSEMGFERELGWCENVGRMTASDSRFDLYVMPFDRCDEGMG
jgi:hypothetical protein